ncbi:hypothetical protein [Bordetella trematum]|uniref:hypothetical protein n=1 Tax=Bordetella trematum TaxID=123899 RepID=UPI003988A559
MEITLSEKDMETLTVAIAKRIEDRVIGKLLMNPSYEALSEVARRWATMQIDAMNFKAEAVEAMRAAMRADGGAMLRSIVLDAVRAVNANDPELRRAVAQGVYQAAAEHADRLRPVD